MGRAIAALALTPVLIGTLLADPVVASAGSAAQDGLARSQLMSGELPAGFLPPQSMARVTKNGTPLRREPGSGTKILRLLRAGELVYLGEADGMGPALVDGATWYRVYAVRGASEWLPPVDTAVRSGWVAIRSDRSQTLVWAPQPCPRQITVEALLAIPPYDRLVCFGSAPLTFRGLSYSDGVGGLPWAAYKPLWLADPFSAGGGLVGPVTLTYGYLTGYPYLVLRAEPGSGVSPPSGLYGGWVQVTARMDHPASSRCTVVGPNADYDFPPLSWELSPLAGLTAEVWCREQLVASDIHTVSGPGSRTPDTALPAAPPWSPLGPAVLAGGLLLGAWSRCRVSRKRRS